MNEKLHARIADLEAALKPFADLNVAWANGDPNQIVFTTLGRPAPDRNVSIRISDILRAQEALRS